MDAEQVSHGQQGRNRIAFYILAALIAAAVGLGIWLASQPLYPVTDDERVLWDAGRGNADWSVYVVEKGQQRALTYDGDGLFSGLSVRGQTFYASCMLETLYPQTLLSIDTQYRFALFLDDELIYTQEPLGDNSAPDSVRLSGSLSGAAQPVVVPLPEDAGGKRLVIAQAQRSAPEDAVSGSGQVYFGPVAVTGQTRLSTGLSSDALRATYPAILLLVLAAVLAGAFLFSVYNSKPNAPTLYLFLCALLWMGSVLCSSEVLAVYYRWTGPLQELFYYDGFAFMFLFLAEQMKRYSKLMYAVAAAYAVLFVLRLIAQYFIANDAVSGVLEALPDILTLPILGFAIVLAFIESAQGNENYRLFTRLFIAGLALYGIVLLISYIRGGFVWTVFSTNMIEGLSTWRFTYLLDVLRYVLIASCFVCTAAQFVRQAVGRGADHIMLRERIKMAEQEYLDLERHAKKEAASRDDVRRHLSVIDEYLESGSTDLAQLYLNQTSVALERTTAPVATRNPVVDTILNAKIFEAREAGIDINVQTGHLPRVLPLSQADLSAVLINTLDNAIAAARRSREKTMAVKVYMSRGYFCYRCENSTGLMVDDAAGKGYGLQIVEEIADAHDASMVFEQGQHIFVLSLSFPTPAANRKDGFAPVF